MHDYLLHLTESRVDDLEGTEAHSFFEHLEVYVLLLHHKPIHDLVEDFEEPGLADQEGEELEVVHELGELHEVKGGFVLGVELEIDSKGLLDHIQELIYLWVLIANHRGLLTLYLPSHHSTLPLILQDGDDYLLEGHLDLL